MSNVTTFKNILNHLDSVFCAMLKTQVYSVIIRLKALRGNTKQTRAGAGENPASTATRHSTLTYTVC